MQEVHYLEAPTAAAKADGCSNEDKKNYSSGLLVSSTLHVVSWDEKFQDTGWTFEVLSSPWRVDWKISRLWASAVGTAMADVCSMCEKYVPKTDACL